MEKKKLFKIGLTIVVVGFIVGVSIAIYLFNMPHRNISSAKADYSLSVSELVDEYLNDADLANEKYLSDDGESKILEVSGRIQSIENDLKGQTVVLIKSANSMAGVKATLDLSNEVRLDELIVGSNITIKGVIRLGASYDSDMEIYINAVLDKGIIL